jgi:hypothetical protein
LALEGFIMDLKSPALLFVIAVISISLTGVLLFYPVNLRLEYAPVEVLTIFNNIFMYGAIFVTWISLLFLLVYISKSNRFVCILVVFLFSAVFLGFSVVVDRGITPESFANIGYGEYLNQHGLIPLGNINLGYFNFPGLYLLESAFSQVLGLPSIYAATVFVFITRVLLFPAICYLFFLKVLKNSFTSLLAAIVSVEGVMVLSRYNTFHPGSMGSLFVLIFILIMGQRMDLSKKSNIALATLLVVSTTITHLVSSFIIVSLIAGTWILLALYDKKQLRYSVMIFILLIIPFLWEIFSPTSPFVPVVQMFGKIVQDLTSNDFLNYAAMLGGANLDHVPFWISDVRLFWLFSVLVPGTFYAIIKLLKPKKLMALEKVLIGSLLGISVLVILMTFASPAGSQFYRFLMFAPVFTIALSILALRSINLKFTRVKKIAVFATILLIISLSFPTFIAHQEPINTNNFYPHEERSIIFLQDHSSETGTGLNFFLEESTTYIYYYMPDIHMWNIPEVGTEIFNSTQFWGSINNVMYHFNSMSDPKIFMFSDRLTNGFGHLLGILPTDIHWTYVQENLTRNNRVYSNSFVQLYS